MRLSDVINTNSRVCLCGVFQHDDRIVVENSLSRFVTDLVHSNCSHLEVQMKIKTCKVCKGNNVETTHASQEYECTFVCPVASLDGNKPLHLKRVHSYPETETPFQAFLTKSQNIIKAEGNFIRIISQICENGSKVRIKLRFDVRSSVKRQRSYSFPNLYSMKKQLYPKESSESKMFDSLRNISQSSFTKSNSSLGKTHSAITILDGEVNIQEYKESEATLVVQETLVESTEIENQVDEIDGYDLNELEKQEIFAKGKFGPLYKSKWC